MLDMSKDPSRDSAAFDAMLELESLFELNGYPRVDVQYRIERQKGTKVVFTVRQNELVVLESAKISAVNRECLEQHSIPADRSADLRLANGASSSKEGAVNGAPKAKSVRRR